MKTADKLTKFRKQAEKVAGTHAAHIEVPLLHVLADVCQTLGITGRQRRRVLGRKSTILLEDTRNERIELVERR